MATTLYNFNAYRLHAGGYRVVIDVSRDDDSDGQGVLASAKDGAEASDEADASGKANTYGSASALGKLKQLGSQNLLEPRAQTVVERSERARLFKKTADTAQDQTDPSALAPAAPAPAAPAGPATPAETGAPNRARALPDKVATANAVHDKLGLLGQEGAANKNATSKHEHLKAARAGLSTMLADGDPIPLYQQIPPPGTDPHTPPHRLGMLRIEDGPAATVAIEDRTLNVRIDIVYRRPAAPDASADLHRIAPDDAAIVVRVYLLAKINAARIEMRDILLLLTQRRGRIAALARRNRSGGLAAQRMLSRLEDDEEHAGGHDHEGGAPRARRRRRGAGSNLLAKARRWSWRTVVAVRKRVHRSPAWTAFARRAAPACDALARHAARYPMAFYEDWLARRTAAMRETLHRWKLLAGLFTVLLFAWILFWVWVPYTGNYAYEPIGSDILACLLVGVGAFFLLNTLNLKTIPDRLDEKVHELAVDELNALLASLVQTNANVASVNLADGAFSAYDDGMAPEALLCRMDDTLHMKERLKSIEAVIKARQAHVLDGAHHIKEHRDRVRRSIAAAGSGVFVGFFTYEVGESVMGYVHVTHQQDSSSMLHWLFANSANIRADERSTKHAAAAPHATATSAHGHPQLDPEFVSNFHKPELYAHSWLLTITIIVSALTAWIAMRKPAEEQGGGHGHH